MNKKALQVKMSLFTGIITTALLVGCQDVKPAEKIPSQSYDPKVVSETQQGNDPFAETEVQKDNTDDGYKILYGEWLVEKKIGESYRLDIQDVSDVIGKTFVFSKRRVIFCYHNEDTEIENPNYKITIIPLDEQTTYFPYMPRLSELGIIGSYVTIFSVRGYDVFFILKDDKSVIMFYKDAYLELRRIEHIEGYDAFYHAL